MVRGDWSGCERVAQFQYELRSNARDKQWTPSLADDVEIARVIGPSRWRSTRELGRDPVRRDQVLKGATDKLRLTKSFMVNLPEFD